jgi:hypothetical protein
MEYPTRCVSSHAIAICMVLEYELVLYHCEIANYLLLDII